MTSNTYGLRLLRQPRVQLTVLALVAVIVLVFRALQFGLLTREIQWGYDFSWYWTAASNLLQGLPIYSPEQLAGPFAPQGQEGFLYPPPLAAAVTPLAAIFSDYHAAAWVWTGLGAAILAWSVLVLHRSEGIGERYPLLAGSGRWLLVAAAFAFPPVVGELVLGNVHLLLLGLLTLAWVSLRRAEPDASDRVDDGGPRSLRHAWLAGAAVGVAAVIKIFPGLLLLWFALTRRSRAAAGVLVGAAAFVAVTLPFTGLEPWFQYPTVLANLSAPSDTTDTLAPTVWLAPYLGFTVARIVVTLAGLAVLAWATLGRSRPDSPTGITSKDLAQPPPISPTPQPARSFAVAVTVSVLIAPALYHHYLVLLVLPLLLALGAGVPLRWLALAYLLMWGGQQNALGDFAWVVNRALPTAGALVLLGALLPKAPARPQATAAAA